MSFPMFLRSPVKEQRITTTPNQLSELNVIEEYLHSYVAIALV